MIPNYQEFMLPILKLLEDKKEHSRSEIYNIQEKFNLTNEERIKKISSGQSILENRIGWALTYLKKALLIESTKRGYYKIKKRGLEVLSKNPTEINEKFLKQFPEFIEFIKLTHKEKSDQKEITTSELTPEDLIQKGYETLNNSLEQELLEKILEKDPNFFENLVLILLSNMGYGEGEVTGKSGDGGIDGFVNQDKLGLDKIYFQAKRYNSNNPVGASMLRDFIGTLAINKASKGVFITTSKFPKDSENVISRSDKKVSLIDGQKLVELMLEYYVGVQKDKVYEIKKIDYDFFE